MSTAPNNTVRTTTNRPVRPRKKMWIFFAVFFFTAVGLYASTMYRIKHFGYTGIGQDQLAHPEDQAPAAAPQN